VRLAILIVASLFVFNALAEEPPAEVNINSLRHPELKRYRHMAAGLDAFDEFRSFAPDATLKFRLVKRDTVRGEKPQWEGTTLRLAGNDLSLPLPVEADGSFILPRSAEANAEDADLVTNKPKGSVRFSARVRTPGLPDNVVRLGDQRLDCRVMLAITKPDIPFMVRATINTLLLSSDWCGYFNHNRKVAFLVTLDDWAMTVHRTSKGQRVPVKAAGYHFRPPFGDPALDDNTVFEFEYWSAASAERKRQFASQFPILFSSSTDKFKLKQPLAAQGEGMYSGTFALKAGKMRVKLSSPEGELVLGASASKNSIPLDKDVPLAWHLEPVPVEVPKDGNYQFSLDLRDVEKPLLKLTPVPLQ
jgi:hypothetical protein